MKVLQYRLKLYCEDTISMSKSSIVYTKIISLCMIVSFKANLLETPQGKHPPKVKLFTLFSFCLNFELIY